MMMLTLALTGTLLGCKPPPPAPEGLDASTSYMVENFYESDPLFQAGVQGFLDWYDTEGYLLVGEESTLSNTDSFTVGQLSAANVANLPLADEILLNGEEDTWGPRDLTRAQGVVSLAEMDCDWIETESYLIRPDQDAVFDGDWDAYEREYLTDKDAFQGASAAAEFDPIEAALDPFSDGFDSSLYEKSILFTKNQADPSKVLFADLDPYELRLDLRHGIYDVDGEDVGAMAILTFNTDAVWDEDGKNGLIQAFSIELNVQQENDKTLRMLAVWAEPYGAGLEPDDPAVLSYAVNKSLGASESLSKICTGETEIGK